MFTMPKNCNFGVLSMAQTGKLGSFQRDLGGATAVKSKGRGEKLTQGRAQGLQGAQKRMLQCTCQMNILDI